MLRNESFYDTMNFSYREYDCNAGPWTRRESVLFSTGYVGQFHIFKNACLQGRLFDQSLESLSQARTDIGLVRELRPRVQFTSNFSGSMSRVPGLSILGFDWPDHVGHQQECAFPMILLQKQRLVDHVFLNRKSITPFAKGIFEAAGSSLGFFPPAACALTRSPSVHPPLQGWHTIRQSQLDPKKSGQHVIPTADDARSLRHEVFARCGIQPRTANHPLRTARILVRQGTARSIENLEEVRRAMEHSFDTVETLYISALDFCTQVQWLHADLVLSIHGSHLVNQLFMQPNTHLIEILPYMYEQDYNTAGCVDRHRHVLVGEESGQWSPRIQRVQHSKMHARIKARTNRIRVPMQELSRLLERIRTNTTHRGKYLCLPHRCRYT